MIPSTSLPHDSPPRKAAFLDRDGVINLERGYVHRVEDFELIPGVIPALQTLTRLGFALVVVTNQGGIGLGLYAEQDMEHLHRHLRKLLQTHGVELAAIYHCPHHPRAISPRLQGPCDCRKPRPGMLLRAINDLQLRIEGSFMVGDKGSDMEAAAAAGLQHRYLVRSGHALNAEDLTSATGVFEHLLDCVDHMVGTPSR